ncbi:MAG TPA: energy transducer TonB [Aequorivita sp.]|nr:energy transducer TonB [Aequorivita sp.]
MDITLTENGEFMVDITKSESPKVETAIQSKFAVFEKIFPVEDKKGNPIKLKFSSIFIININSQGKIGMGLKNQPIGGFEEEQNLPYDIIEKVPVFPGCIGNNNEELRNCLSKNITNHVIKEFNFSLVNKLDLPKGLTRIYVNFKIDKKGRVVDVVAKADHDRLEKEAIRVLNKVPRMEPGEQKGKAVGVLYSLPIVLQVE